MERKKWILCLLPVAVLLASIFACNAPEGTTIGGPMVTILSPSDGDTVVVGQQVLVTSSASDAKGISRVELIVNSTVVRTDPPLDRAPVDFDIAQSWFPDRAGDAVVQVVAYNTDDVASAPASITLRVVENASGETPGAGPTSTPVPDVTAEAGCTLNASFVEDVTIPDGSELQPGVNFVKTWRIRNSGTCEWGPGFDLAFVGGDQMGAVSVVPVAPTAAGATADVSVSMAAPSAPGTYKGNWRMRSDEGKPFGSTVWVEIVVPSPATDTPEPTLTPTPTNTPEPTPTTVPPAAPTDLVKSTLPSGFVSLVWVDHASDEEGFHVLADGEIHTSLGANTEGWGFHTGDYFCDETVQITIVAYKGSTWSDPSNAVEYVGPPCPPPIVAQGTGVTMTIPTYIDLDTGTTSTYNAEVDFLWQSSGGYRLIGMNGMQFADVGIGPSVPSYVGCSSATRSESAIYIPALQAGTRLCFDTTEGNLAGVRVDEVQADYTIVLSFVTWEGP